MNKLITMSSTAALSVVIAGSVTATAFACHPQGKITKSVQNVTTSSAVMPADTAASAVNAKFGDVLEYTIVVSNTADKGDNDLTATVLTDNLPSGVALVSDLGGQNIKANIGTIKPGDSVTKKYQVKVISDTAGSVIENKACYSANNRLNNMPLSGCDVADVKVNVPVTPATPVTPAAPETPVDETPGKGAETAADLAPPAELPNTGMGSNVLIGGSIATVFGFIASTIRQKRSFARDQA